MNLARENAFEGVFGLEERAAADARADFIGKTYLHLGGAIIAFVALTAAILNYPGIDGIIRGVLGMANGYGWLIVFGGFMVVSWVAESWARSATSKPMQYAGLGLYVLAEAIFFTPLLYIASRFGGAEVIPTAGLLTLVTFGGLSIVVFFTRKNFSFLAPALGIASFAALGYILCGIFFGWTLGITFTVLMIVLASGYVLYTTSNVLHEYHTDQYVAASLALFASVALLFWYILQLVMRLQSRD